jgi:preprotein translocase subunit SecG
LSFILKAQGEGMKKLTAVLLAVFFVGSTGLVLADGTPTGKRMHKPYLKHHKKGKNKIENKGTAAPAAGMENRVNN